MAKKVIASIKLQINAGKATPSPPIGPALGQHGVNIMEFCKAYNAMTQSRKAWVILLSSRFMPTGPLLSWPDASRIRSAQTGGQIAKDREPKTGKGGRRYAKQVKDIAELKFNDLNAVDMPGAIRIIEGTARSMGIEIQG